MLIIQKGASDRRHKRVAFFVQRYLIGTSPTIVNSVQCLVEKGYQVDLVVYRCINLEEAAFDSSHVQVFDLTPSVNEKTPEAYVSSTWQSWGNRALRYIGNHVGGLSASRLTDAVKGLRVCSDYHLVLSAQARSAAKLLEGRDYTFWIGFDTDGLNLAFQVNACRNTAVPVIYWSLEVLFEDRSFDRLVGRQMEIEYHRSVTATIIQDEERAQILGRHNRIDHRDMLHVPCAVRGRPVRHKSNYFRSMFGIPENKKIVLYTGSIQAWAMCREMVETVDQWPLDWVLVMHTFHPVTWPYPSALLAELRGKTSGRVFISDRPVKYEDLAEVISGGDIGIGFYRDSEPGNTVVGAASGKFAYYSRCGLPFITNDYPSLRGLAERYGCAEVVSQVEGNQIREAIVKIEARYQTYRKNAFACFEACFNFDFHFERAFEEIQGRLKLH